MIDKGRQHLRRRRKEARPTELLDAALQVFLKKGFAATTLEDVAIRAGASKGTIYLYFESKEALFKAVMESGLKPANEMIEEVVAATAFRDRPASELLHSYVQAWQRILVETPIGSLLKILVAESGKFPEVLQCFHDAVVRPARSVMTRIVEAGIARGEIRPVGSELVASMFFSPMCLCAFVQVWGCQQPIEQLMEDTFAVLARDLLDVTTN